MNYCVRIKTNSPIEFIADCSDGDTGYLATNESSPVDDTASALIYLRAASQGLDNLVPIHCAEDPDSNGQIIAEFSSRRKALQAAAAYEEYLADQVGDFESDLIDEITVLPIQNLFC